MCDDLDLLKTQSKITLSLLPHTLLEVREEINFAAAARLKEIIGQLGNPNQNIHKSCWPFLSQIVIEGTHCKRKRPWFSSSAAETYKLIGMQMFVCINIWFWIYGVSWRPSRLFNANPKLVVVIYRPKSTALILFFSLFFPIFLGLFGRKENPGKRKEDVELETDWIRFCILFTFVRLIWGWRRICASYFFG